MSLSFQVEWLDAPGVSDIVDSCSWARLVILGADGDPLTRCFDRKTGQTREGVYGSVFALARWIADSYWNLLYEAPRVPRARSGRELARYPGLAPWLRRHNMLTAREGYSLPDISLARDGEHIVVWSFPDGPPDQNNRPIQFLHQGISWHSVREVDAALQVFMGTVLERLRDVRHASVDDLRADWGAILASREQERDLCEWAARLGLDPYDPDDLPQADEQLLIARMAAVPEDLRGDVLDATDSVAGARSGSDWLSQLGAGWGAAPPRGNALVRRSNGVGSAYEAGYGAARLIRKEQSLRASDSPILGKLASAYGLQFETEVVAAPPDFVDGLLAAMPGSSPVILGEDLPHEDKSFRWSRALYLWRFGHSSRSARLITRSHGRLQQESRAFAAELLAPAAAIRSALRSNVVGDDEIESIAKTFGVRAKLVRHQIENHDLAMME